MWSTIDGCVLRLPEARLQALDATRGRGAQGEQCSCCVVKSIQSEIGSLVNRSRHTGVVRSRRTGRCYRIFEGTGNHRPYRIIARPLGGVQYAISAVIPNLATTVHEPMDAPVPFGGEEDVDVDAPGEYDELNASLPFL